MSVRINDSTTLLAKLFQNKLLFVQLAEKANK